MSKRRLPDQAAAFKDDAKRVRLDEPSKAKPETITSARQLQTLLTFKQDAVSQLRTGIHSFKLFLDGILYPPEAESPARSKAILHEYLESQKPRDLSDRDKVFLPSLIEIWSFATQTSSDNLFSAVSAVIALLLKTLSHDLDLKDYGLLLCNTILQIPQLKLVSRGLSAERHKEYLISPCLRLLVEVVSFDGGVVAKQVYAKRDFTFNAKTIARHLGMLGKESPNDRGKPSVRSHAVRYLLAHLKHQDEGAKIDILKQGNILRALLENLKFDPPATVKDILSVLKVNVIQDSNVPRNSKSYLLQDRNLSHIAALYRIQQPTFKDSEGQEVPVNSLVHDFLLYACTTPGAGALAPSSGWYPPGSESDTLSDDRDGSDINLGLDSVDWYNRFQGRVVVKNIALATFIQGLRPYANIQERELLLAIFQAAPELVADYFFKKTNFSFEPKLTATWIGYSAFLFSTVQLPVPAFFGAKDDFRRVPPPVSIIIESILPSPLNQKSLTKAINANSGLITFFAVRLMVIAFQKLQRVLEMFKHASADGESLWTQASSRLLEEFSKRAPKMKDVILAFNRTAEDKSLEREAITRLISLYYEVITRTALNEKFDVAVPLTNLLLMSESNSGANVEAKLRLLELSHLVKVAQLAPNMRWWHKPESLRHTPFMTLLKLIARAETAPSKNIVELLSIVIQENCVVQQETKPTAFDALLTSLQTTKHWEPSDGLFEFLDECIIRLVRRPIAYQDALDSIICKEAGIQAEDLRKPVSLILAPLVEQWRFMAKNQRDGLQSIAQWIQRFFQLLKQIGENEGTLTHVLNELCEASSSVNGIDILLSGTSNLVIRETALQHSKLNHLEDNRKQETNPNGKLEGTDPLDIQTPPAEDEKHMGLNRWIHKEVEQAIDDGILGELVLCLCSKHESIRIQALSNIRKFLEKGKTSDYAEWEQIELLLRELIETSSPVISNQPLPYVAGVFACRAIGVLADPMHVLYGKLNKFLLKAPSWNISRLPSYWTEKALLHPPDDDTGHRKELEWLLDFLFDALRTPEDMEIYRARNIFERILALYSLQPTSQDVQLRILKICFRAVAVEGSTTLITRSGVLSWIQAQLLLGGRHTDTLKRLADRLGENCDQGRVMEWSKPTIFGVGKRDHQVTI